MDQIKYHNRMKTYWIDLFCGAGGTSTGIHLADANATVIACVNHDKKAIESHKANHPNCLHLTEDVRDFKVVQQLKVLVDKLRKQEPGCIINIWASLECINFSKAKGGLPRDADSRTLAESLFMYLEQLNPDYIYIENVREFMAWGPLDKNGRPLSYKNGADYVKWCNKIQEHGYNYDFKLLNSADFGAYTSRLRYFGQFAKKGMPIAWPTSTHCKKLPKEEGFFPSLKKKWKAVKEVLNLENEGQSIFIRKKDLSENTHKRILAGLIKFVAGGQEAFTKVYNSGNDAQRVKSINEPIGSLTTQNSHAVVKSVFLTHSHGGNPFSKVWSIDRPTRTITTFNNHYIVNNVFLSTYYGNGGNHNIEAPCPTLTTKDRVSYIVMNYSNSDAVSIEKPGWSITTNPKHSLVTTKKWLVDHQFANKGRSINEAAPTIIARQDKKPLYIISCDESKDFAIVIFESDNPTMVKIKEFMVMYGIIDIKMRMLQVDELLKIQGFPADYILKGTKTDQKKFIGNSVVPIVAQRLVESNSKALKKYFEVAA